MKCNVCKYYLPQIGLIDGSFPLWEKLKFKSSFSHQHTLLFGLHYSSQPLHYSCHLASHFVPCIIYKEPHKVSIIIIIIEWNNHYYYSDYQTHIYFWMWGPYGLLLPHLPSLWFVRRLFGMFGMPGFISELWHLNQDSDLGPNGTSGVPQVTTSAVSTTAETAAEKCKDILRISMTFSKNREFRGR